MELRLGLSFGHRRTNDLDCGRTPRQRKAFRCSGIGQSLDSLPQCSDGRPAPFTSFGSVDRTRSCAQTLRSTPAAASSARIVTKRRRRSAAMLNSARRLSISPRRGRRVERSDPRPGIRFHSRPRRFCRRCASDASYESMGNAGSIDVTTSDIPLRTDSVKRCKG